MVRSAAKPRVSNHEACHASNTVTPLSLRRRPLADTTEPGGDVGVGGVERLANLAEVTDRLPQPVALPPSEDFIA